jgi:DNA end-binding protein Ku
VDGRERSREANDLSGPGDGRLALWPPACEVDCMPHTVWKGQLLFDVFCIPIKLCAAARENRLPFRLVYGLDPPAAQAATAAAGAGTGHVLHFPGNEPTEAPIPGYVAPVRRTYMGMDGVPLPPDAIFKAYHATQDHFAVFRPSELARLHAPKSDTLAIAEFVSAKEIDPKYFDLSYNVWPDRGGERLYELFHLGLSDNGFMAVGEVALSGRERWIAIRPGEHGLVLHTLFFSDEVRHEDEYHLEVRRISRKERVLMGELMRARRGKFNGAQLTNKYHQRLLEFVVERCGKSFRAGGPDQPPQSPPVADITEALHKSIELARKPPRREDPGPGPRKGKHHRGSRS